MSDGHRILRHHLDAASMITFFLFTCAIPSYLVITAVGSVGRPSLLVCMAMFAWWLAHQLQRPFGSLHRGAQPVRLALALLAVVVVSSYISAMFRGLPAAEVSPADNGLLRMLAWCGIFLVAHDGLRTRANVLLVLRRIVLAGSLMAMLGLMQFATKNTLLGWLAIRGMSGEYYGGVDQRAGFVRAAGTATHPLEYGLVLCVTLPLSLALAMSDRARPIVCRWTPAVIIASASALSVSRSALISVVVGTAVVAASWSWRQKCYAVVFAVFLGVIVYFTVPGMAGTIVGMFTGLAGDSSVASRVNSYDVAFAMVGRLPLLGRGFGTLLPSYVYLDNQYLGIVVEAGLLGCAALLGLLLAAVLGSWTARRWAVLPIDAAMGAGIAAAVCAGATAFAFFDGLSFTLSSTLIFLVAGIAGAYRRVMKDEVTRQGELQPTVDADARA